MAHCSVSSHVFAVFSVKGEVACKRCGDSTPELLASQRLSSVSLGQDGEVPQSYPSPGLLGSLVSGAPWALA